MSSQNTQNKPAPGTWSGLQCSSRYGSLVNIIARREPEYAGDLPAVWAIRTEDNALRAYLLSDLRFDGGINQDRMNRIEAMPELSRAQAEAIRR